LKEHSFNFYHWLFECLPRLNFLIANLSKLGQHEKLTILVDGDILPGGMEAMQRLIKFPYEIEVVRRGELVSCDKLFYVSPFWFSLDNSRHQVDAYRDYAVDKYAVQTTRDSFRDLASRAAPTRKIYLPRIATQVRRIINAEQVEALMRDNGFEIVHAHDLTFAGQVELFSSAKVLIGASGAAFSNMVFMQPGTKAVIFSPKQLEVFNYYIFQQLADVAGVGLSHLLSVPAKKDDFFIHDNFTVNLDDLKTLVSRISA
jgi:capsular polysaccharide biosynthesis protein